jgi:formylglycine-generating enzyme required for sulfatase activity
LRLDATTGAITGKPSAGGVFIFTIKATNEIGSDTKQFLITIIGIEMIQIQPGTFTMGSPTYETGHCEDETQHQVTLTGFKMSKYPVTQGQYEAVMGNNPNYTPGTDAVGSVTWYDAVEFCNKLSTLEELTPVYTITDRTPTTGYPITAATVTANWSANGYRLPTEAQWEYSCRAGTTTAYYMGDTLSNNYSGGFNAWGLYMHSSVFEMCWDWYSSSYYSSSPAQDPTGPDSGSKRVIRGGLMTSILTLGVYAVYYMRSAFRCDSLYPNSVHPELSYGPGTFYPSSSALGFRVVRPL